KMATRRSYEESCNHLREVGLLAHDDPAPMPERLPRYDDEEPLGLNFLLLPRLCWIAHERRRDLARFDGSRDRASMMFQSCFLAVETKERISAKSIAPCNDRKPPEIFCRSFIMRPSRSA